MLQVPLLIHDGNDWNVALHGDCWRKLTRDLANVFHRPAVFLDELEAFVAEALAENGIVPDSIADDLEVGLPPLPADLHPQNVADAFAPVPADVLEGLLRNRKPD